MASLFFCALPAIGVVYLLIVVPIVGSWLSGWPAMPAALRFSAVVAVASVVLTIGVGSGSWVLWDRGIIGNKFPFALQVPDGFDGLALVEACPTAPEGPVVRVSEQGLGAVRHADPSSLCGRNVVEVAEAGGAATQVAFLMCEDDPTSGCALLAFGVSRTSPWGHPFPGVVPLAAMLAEVRTTGNTVTEVSKAHAPPDDPLGP